MKEGIVPTPSSPGAARRAPLPIGTATQWGYVAAIGVKGGERYYMLAQGADIALMPANVVETAPPSGEPLGEPAPDPTPVTHVIPNQEPTHE